jgi:hypothetical protein
MEEEKDFYAKFKIPFEQISQFSRALFDQGVGIFSYKKRNFKDEESRGVNFPANPDETGNYWMEIRGEKPLCLVKEIAEKTGLILEV